MSTNAFCQLLGREQPIRFHNGLLRVHPLRLNRIEPRALFGKQERQNAYSFASQFDLLVVLPNPHPHQFADMPGGVIPDHEPMALALRGQTLTTIAEATGR
jgi:hypothetical protein